MILRFILNNLSSILFFIVLFLTLYTDQAVQYAATVYVLVEVSSLMLVATARPEVLRDRLYLLKTIVAVCLMGLTAYDNNIKIFAFGIAVYHVLITFAIWWGHRKHSYFVEKYDPKYLSPMTRLEVLGVPIATENRNSFVKSTNELYLRNYFIMSCLYLVILPATNLASPSWYVLLAFLLLPIVNMLLIFNLSIRLFKMFQPIFGDVQKDMMKFDKDKVKDTEEKLEKLREYMDSELNEIKNKFDNLNNSNDKDDEKKS
ncbi:hypothetical protein CKF54_02340 [Psittacicella hinzii]|uniref:Uncharacterized protein n=1 Tax=Psittacicella hinzii TaxID=2028575 RepID=A0A3A1Y7X2_9GAMM|nr:hypothetical protein [Psittacicella hinzii]RIY33735.1 hypothetical protein CKF54_02340 [Psittacicella hinzii]